MHPIVKEAFEASEEFLEAVRSISLSSAQSSFHLLLGNPEFDSRPNSTLEELSAHQKFAIEALTPRVVAAIHSIPLAINIGLHLQVHCFSDSTAKVFLKSSAVMHINLNEHPIPVAMAHIAERLVGISEASDQEAPINNYYIELDDGVKCTTTISAQSPQQAADLFRIAHKPYGNEDGSDVKIDKLFLVVPDNSWA